MKRACLMTGVMKSSWFELLLFRSETRLVRELTSTLELPVNMTDLHIEQPYHNVNGKFWIQT